MLEAVHYCVTSIDGDYANLVLVNTQAGNEPKLVARALLPEAIEEGTILKYECFQYTIEN